MSAAWVVSEESFLKNVKSLNLLKLRFGYGVTGQQDGIGDYAYISNYYEGATTAQYAFGGQYYTVFRPGGFDANLRWEQTESYNFGLDFGILKDRFSGSLDLYQKNTTDLLAVVPVPAGTNFTNEILTNVGSMMNQGIEFSLNAGLFADKNNRLDLTFNVSHNINQVVKLAQIEDPNATGVLVGGISGGIGNTVQVHRVGYPTFSFLLYEQQYDSDGNFIEVNQQANIDINEDGMVDNLDKWKDIHAYVDRNNDGIINIEDRYVAAQVAPDIFIGGALNYRHKNWTFGVSFRSEIGGHIYNNVHFWYDFYICCKFRTKIRKYLFKYLCRVFGMSYKRIQRKCQIIWYRYILCTDSAFILLALVHHACFSHWVCSCSKLLLVF